MERQAQSQVDVERIRSELELLKTVEPPKIPFSIRAPVPDFRGYEEERAAIRAALAGGNTVNISAVHGMGGAGKSELARKVADEMAADFPDGQILVDMLGTTQQPRTAAEAMTDVLLALGAKAVDPRTLAADYHSRLGGKRLLILLDNVANSAGLDELHPQPPTTLLVTSRTRLAIPGVQSVELERLSRDAAKALLVEIVPRLDDPTSEVLAQLCCDLPLALRVAGAYLDETGASAELYINDLKRRRLHYLARSAGDIERPDLDPRYVLGLSYDRLAETHPAIARIFALLSAFPADFDTAGAAAVVDLGPDKTRRHLAQLTRRSLVQRHGDNRYRLHDLLRELGRQHAPEADVHKACERYIHHYDQLLKTRLLNYFENPDPPKTISEFEHELPHFIHIVLNLIERDSIGATLYAHNLAQMATVVFYFDVAEVCYSICIPGIRSAAAREPQYKGYAATILSNYAPFLHALERNHEALSAIDEAITRYEQIPDVSPEKTFALAQAYAIRADCLDSVGSAASARWSNATAIRLLQRVLQNDLANAHFLPLWRDKYREQCARHGVEADVELIAAIEADLTEIKASTGRSLSYN